MISKSLWHINKTLSEIRSEEIDDVVNNNQLILYSEYSMISTGTEYLVSSGLVDIEFKDKMKVPYMNGTFSLPIKYGYACCGKDANGNCYHFMHPHQSICAINKKDVFAINDLDSKKVPLISNMETVLNGIWDAELVGNENIAVIGYGNIGSLLSRTLLVQNNLKVTIIEKDKERLDLAKLHSYNTVNTLDETYDVIYNTTGSSEVINVALKHLKMDGKLIELSWHANKTSSLKLGHHFHYNRLRIISSQVSNIPKIVKDKIDYNKRKEIAVELLKNSSYDELITDIIDFNDAPEFFSKLRNNKISKGLIYLFKYN